MAFPTGSETSTTLAVMIPLLWGEKINDFYKMKLVTADFFVNRSDELANGGSTLYTPNITEMTAYAKSNAAAVTLNQPTETKISLVVNQWFEVSFAIEDDVASQTKHSYYLMERYAKNAGYSIAKKLEFAITSQFTNFASSVGTSVANVTDGSVRSAIANLEAADVDTSSEVSFFFDSKVFWNQLQAIDKFSLAINAPVQDPVSKRPTAMLYGIPVFISNTIATVAPITAGSFVVAGVYTILTVGTTDFTLIGASANTIGVTFTATGVGAGTGTATSGRINCLAQNDAIHYATSPLGAGESMGAMVGANGIRVQSNYIPEYLSTLTTSDILYGVVMNRSTAGVKILSNL